MFVIRAGSTYQRVGTENSFNFTTKCNSNTGINEIKLRPFHTSGISGLLIFNEKLDNSALETL